MAAKTYIIYNGVQAAAAAPVKQPTGTAIRTMMQVSPLNGIAARVIEWGCSFDASAAVTPGQVELFDTTVAATMSTAYASADIGLYGDQNAPAGSNYFGLTTVTSGFATAAVTEGTVANYRCFDLQMLDPFSTPYMKQFPLGREPELISSGTLHYLRVRMTFATTVNAYCYVILEV